MLASKRSQRSKNQPKFEEEKVTTAAFVLCNPIDSTLSPISKEYPPCLFPLCDIPVLYYNLQWLQLNGIEKVYIVCQDTHEKSILKYLKQWRETITIKSIETAPISKRNYQINSLGDSIRWIYTSSSIVLNFENCVIVPGTVVTNIPLKQIVSQHEKRMKKPNKGKGKPILTTVFTQTKLNNSYSILIDNEGKILGIDLPNSVNFDDKKKELAFQKVKSTSIKTNLHDSQIYICAPELMETFSSGNNFTWNSMMNDCVASIIDLEIERKTVHASILPDSFASHVNDLQSYIESSLAVINNRLSPITLESNQSAPSRSYSLFFDEQTDDDEEEQKGEEEEEEINENVELTEFKLLKELVYVDKDVKVSDSSKIGPSVVIGKGTTIEDGCEIQNAVIGSDCVVKKGSIIKNCIIWDRVTIEENVRIDHSLIASDVSIKKDIIIKFGCVVSFNAIVDVDLPPCRRLTGYEIGENNIENEIEFRAEPPKWLKCYIKNKTPIPLSEVNYFEYKPCTDSEIPFLHLWHSISPDTFPIDMSKIESEEQENVVVDDEEEEDDELE